MPISEIQSKRLLAELKKKEELYHICLSNLGAGPLDGGCYAVAKALQENLGGELYTLWGRSRESDIKQGQHILLRLGNSLWDADGKHSEVNLTKLWEKEESLYDISILPFIQTDIPESSREESFVETLKHYFKSVLEIDPSVTAQVRSIVYQVDNLPEKNNTPATVIPQLLKSDEWNSLTPYEINNDNCDQFAFDIVKNTGGEVWETKLDCDLPTHFFIKWQDKFYDAQTPQGVSNWKMLPVYRPALDFHIEHKDYHSGQNDYTIVAKQDNQTVGYLDYSEYQETPAIQFLQVSRHNRRKGIATELILKLQENYPDMEIKWGQMSQAMYKLYKSIPKLKVPIDKVIAHQEQLKNVRNKLSEYALKAEAFRKIENPTKEQRQTYDEETADWDELHDLDTILEEFYENEPSHKTLIDIPITLPNKSIDAEHEFSMEME
ncbi:MAG: GNAT family N-acetyltransferase [Desulfobacteraceae bacterium]|nr:GNAT family N-acetyltransferase [Desulfobacteraceae bacterium]